MARTKLQSVSFETGMCMHRTIPGIPVARDHTFWYVIGKYGADLFMLMYSNGYTNWYSDVNLTDSIRTKILGHFKNELRDASLLPAYVRVHDLRAADVADLKSSDANAGDISLDFHDNIWLKQYCGIEYIKLNVPFHEKDAAFAAGAVWNAGLKVWQAVKGPNMDRFKRWLPDSV